MRDIWQPLLIFVTDLYPIKSVHIRHIEPIAILTPHFVEDLGPFLLRIDLGDHPSCRNRLLVAIALRGCIHDLKSALTTGHELAAISGNRKSAGWLGEHRLFAVLYGKN